MKPGDRVRYRTFSAVVIRLTARWVVIRLDVLGMRRVKTAQLTVIRNG